MAFWLTLHSPSRTSSSLFLGQDFVSLVLSLNATPPLSQSNSGGGAVKLVPHGASLPLRSVYLLRRVKRQRTRNEGQKGSQNREALVWRLIDPDGNTHKAVNLLDWARQNHLQARSSFVRSRRRRARVAAPSICCAAACILLAAAPTAPPCFGHRPWSSPLQTYKKNEHPRLTARVNRPKISRHE